jgi:hypothetical protein
MVGCSRLVLQRGGRVRHIVRTLFSWGAADCGQLGVPILSSDVVSYQFMRTEFHNCAWPVHVVCSCYPFTSVSAHAVR